MRLVEDAVIIEAKVVVEFVDVRLVLVTLTKVDDVANKFVVVALTDSKSVSVETRERRDEMNAFVDVLFVVDAFVITRLVVVLFVVEAFTFSRFVMN